MSRHTLVWEVLVDQFRVEALIDDIDVHEMMRFYYCYNNE